MKPGGSPPQPQKKQVRAGQGRGVSEAPESGAAFEEWEGAGSGSEASLPVGAQGVSGPSSSCVWNLQVFPDDARGCQCPFVYGVTWSWI